MTWILIAVYALLGALVGVALNQVIDRAPRRVPIWSPGPRCDYCSTPLGPRDMLPVVGYLARRGRCAVCGGEIPRRVLWVEVVTALLFAILAWYRGLTFELLADSIYTVLFVVIAVIDLEHHLILNRIVYPAIYAALGIAVLRLLLRQPRGLHYGFWQDAGLSAGASPAAAGLSSQLAGGLVGLAIFFVLYLLSRGSLGDGDVRLAFLCGLIVGYPGALLVVMGAILMAGLVSAGLLISRRATRKTAIPFGPFLVIAAWAVNLYGEQWLVRLIG